MHFISACLPYYLILLTTLHGISMQHSVIACVASFFAICCSKSFSHVHTGVLHSFSCCIAISLRSFCLLKVAHPFNLVALIALSGFIVILVILFRSLHFHSPYPSPFFPRSQLGHIVQLALGDSFLLLRLSLNFTSGP